MRIVATVLLLAMRPMPAHAQEEGECAARLMGGADTHVAFVNGVYVNRLKARRSARALQYALEQRDPSFPSRAEVCFLYNGTHGLLADLAEAAVMRGNPLRVFWEWLDGTTPAAGWLLDTLTTELRDTFDPLAEIAAVDLERHVDFYEAALAEGNQVILVAHSQGNLFARPAQDLLEGTGSGLQVVGVAPPVPRGWEVPYVTDERDRVIELVAGLYPDTLSPNMANTPAEGDDWLHHAFIGNSGGNDELVQLVREGILTRDGDRLAVAAEHLNLLREDVQTRLDSLRHFLEAVTQTIHQRFFTNDGVAFARVLTFNTDSKALRDVSSEAYAAVRAAVVRADRQAPKSDALQASAALCIVQAPDDPPWLVRK